MDEDDQYFAFDYEDQIETLFEDFKRLPEVRCSLHAKGNSKRMHDSYNWKLSDMLLEMKEQEKDGIFDVAYLDGNHTLAFDGLACWLLKQLVKKGGYLIFDDVDWSYKKYRATHPTAFERYTEEQVADCQIKRVINLFMRDDGNFREIYLTGTLVPSRVVYQRLK